MPRVSMGSDGHATGRGRARRVASAGARVGRTRCAGRLKGGPQGVSGPGCARRLMHGRIIQSVVEGVIEGVIKGVVEGANEGANEGGDEGDDRGGDEGEGQGGGDENRRHLRVQSRERTCR